MEGTFPELLLDCCAWPDEVSGKSHGAMFSRAFAGGGWEGTVYGETSESFRSSLDEL